MNSIIARVSNIKKHNSLHIVEFNNNSQTLSMMSLNISDKIQIGTKVKLLVKSSHITIAKKFTGSISYSNKLKAKIINIKNGELLSSIKLDILDTTLESIITATLSKEMNLKTDDEVIVFINASELSIGEIYND